MLSAADNKKLTRTGPDTPMGRTFRKYWMPALLSRELPHPDCPPVRLKLLGEEFVAFRDTLGKVGIVEPRCPHRGANLFFGRNEACGLRCIYHGWKFDRQGNCVDIPNATPEVASRLMPRASIQALTVEERGDVVWAFFGESAPPLPDFEYLGMPSEQRFVSKKFQQCNWAQAVEGGLDTSHFSYLHAGVYDGEKASLLDGGKRPTLRAANESPNHSRFRWLIEDGAPRFTVLEHDAGLLLCAARSADDDQTYWRMTQYLVPNHSLTPGNFPEDTSLMNTWVPYDDESCWIFCYAWHPDREISDDERTRYREGRGLFAEVDDDFVPVRRRENDYLIDRDMQRGTNYTGIANISEQDQAVADSQGTIADRTQETLLQTDLGITRFRATILNACQSVEEGVQPKGASDTSAFRVRSGDYVSEPHQSLVEVVHARFGEFAGKNIVFP
ncbi:MAG: Rieske 2Fe-2S domain-containing protein [Gammaproteobacteria bacterium]|nr:Rieske 2Fe-2S domain-containing protein [Gammaproteobacteria bacterium]